MMKKVVLIATVAGLMASLGMGVMAAERPTEGSGKIGFAVTTLGAEYFSVQNEQVHEMFEADGYEVVTVSCEGNAAQQVSDIENLISMDCEAIFYYALDPDALVDVLKKAREEGIKMYAIALTYDDTDVYDANIDVDQYGIGVDTAQMMAEWVEESFPDAEERSIEVAAFGLTSTVGAANRTAGMCTIEDLSSKIKLVEVFDMTGSTTDGQVLAQQLGETAMSKYPEIKGFLSYGADSSLGLNEACMRNAELNRKEFAIFGVDDSSALYDIIEASETDEGLIRGHMTYSDIPSAMHQVMLGQLELDENKNAYLDCIRITPENVADYR